MKVDLLGNIEVNYAMSAKKKIVGIGLLSLLSLAPIFLASIGLAICSEDRCNGGDPIGNGCDDDAYSFDQTVKSYQDWFVSQEIKVELRYSPKCQAVWARAGRLKANDSSIWVETKDGQQYNHYSPSKNGTYYSSMRQKLPGTKACAKVGNQTWCTEGMP
jgi:Zn-finger nucleic acid-binding protein